MNRLLPQTLFAQTLLVLLAGISLALLAGTVIYSSAREQAVRAVGALGVAERIINVSRLVAESPADWRERLAQGSSDVSFSVTLSDTQPVLREAESESPAAIVIANFIKQSLLSTNVAVAMAGASQEPDSVKDEHSPRGLRHGRGPGFGQGAGQGFGTGFGPHMGQGMEQGSGRGMRREMIHGPLGEAVLSWRALKAGIELPNGQWLLFTTTLPDVGPRLSSNLFLALLVTMGMVALLTALAARRLTGPLRVLSDAATRLGHDVEAPPLAATGSVEVRRAAEAFNDMQSRLRTLIRNRTLMIAAISHDLRTQLTLLRLRTESSPMNEDRERMLGTIADMEEMLSATLSFAGDEAQTETRRRVDLSALVSSIADDMADAGLHVTTGHIRDGAIVDCKPAALRRAITNLIENAVKYGSRATISLDIHESGIVITVDDEGPGIPEDQISSVLQPFYRLDTSRSRETGGIGLGLAIAASIIETHDGTLTLTNRIGGGLQARMFLPLI